MYSSCEWGIVFSRYIITNSQMTSRLQQVGVSMRTATLWPIKTTDGGGDDDIRRYRTRK